MSAAEQIAAFSCKYHPFAARLSYGVRCISPVPGYNRTSVLVWRLSSSYVRTIEGEAGNSGRIQLCKEFEDWEQLYSLQLLGSDDLDYEPQESSTDSIGTTQGDYANASSEGRLSTISEEDDSGDEHLSEYLSHSDEQFQSVLEGIRVHYNDLLENAIEADDLDGDHLDEAMYRTPLSLYV